MLILASQSPYRQQMLQKAGIEFTAQAAHLAEESLIQDAQARGASAQSTVRHLAKAKAQAISQENPKALVIGCDQMLICGKRWFSKARNHIEAQEHLRFLSGKTHHLLTSVVVVQDGQVLWEHSEQADMHMRVLSDRDIADYLRKAGDGILSSVGCYQIEALGAQLFDRIDGDFFSIIGLPLLPLLGFLRTQNLSGA